jgi:hypothetical protein
VSSRKHAPCRPEQILETQLAQIDRLRAEGFVLFPELSVHTLEKIVIVGGYVRCEGGLYLQVHQHIVPVARTAHSELAVVGEYSYKGVLQGRGTIFRYDSPHADHNREHHVHEYDVLAGDKSGTVRFLYSDDEIPTLPEALRLLQRWYFEHQPLDQHRG